MKQFRIYLVVISLILIISSCQHTKKHSDDKVILNAIDTLIKAGEIIKKSDYLINPFVGSFDFNTYSNKFYPEYGISDGSKKEVLKQLHWSNFMFDSIQKTIAAKYKGRYYDKEMTKYSQKRSTNLITFSGIHDNIVFVEIIDFCYPIKIEQLNENNDYLNEPKSNISSLVILLEKEEVKKIFVDNAISLELQCN